MENKNTLVDHYTETIWNLTTGMNVEKATGIDIELVKELRRHLEELVAKVIDMNMDTIQGMIGLRQN